MAPAQTQEQLNGNGEETGEKTAKPTRYMILYRTGDMDTNAWLEARDPEGKPDKETNEHPRLVIEAFGQPKAREDFWDRVLEDRGKDEDDQVWGAVVAVAAVPWSSWDPKVPRQRVLTEWG